jgi:hypothetical protein
VSRESGVSDIYVAPFPGPGGTRRVTSGGADMQFGAPRRLFASSFVTDAREDGPRGYEVSPDGKRFLMLMDATTPVAPPVFQVLLNWVGELKR